MLTLILPAKRSKSVNTTTHSSTQAATAVDSVANAEEREGERRREQAVATSAAQTIGK